MGVRLWSRWARGPVRSMGIDPAKRPARDTQVVSPIDSFSERAFWSRWARHPVLGMGINTAEKRARDMRATSILWLVTEQAV